MAWRGTGRHGEGLDGTGQRGTGRYGEGVDVVERDGTAWRGTGQGGEGRDRMERDGTVWGGSSSRFEAGALAIKSFCWNSRVMAQGTKFVHN